MLVSSRYHPLGTKNFGKPSFLSAGEIWKEGIDIDAKLGRWQRNNFIARKEVRNNATNKDSYGGRGCLKGLWISCLQRKRSKAWSQLSEDWWSKGLTLRMTQMDCYRNVPPLANYLPIGRRVINVSNRISPSLPLSLSWAYITQARWLSCITKFLYFSEIPFYN